MSAPLCRYCDRRALTIVNGRYKASKNHDLCRQCFAQIMARAAALRIPPARPRGPQVPMPELLE